MKYIIINFTNLCDQNIYFSLVIYINVIQITSNRLLMIIFFSVSNVIHKAEETI